MGVLVEEFGLGLPPRLFGKKFGETIYSINLLPFGGFVKIYGEEGEKKENEKAMDSKRAFFTKPVSQKALIVSAGVIMNSLLAIIIFYIFLTISNFKTEIPLLFDYKFFGVNQTNKTEIILTQIAPGSPAEKAGIRQFSKVISVNSKTIQAGQDFTNIINENKGKIVRIELQDLTNFNIYKTEVTPRVSPPENEGPLGVGFAPAQTAVLSYDSGIQKIFSGVIHPVNLFVYNIDILGRLIGISYEVKSATPIGEAVGGPLRIFSLAEQIAQIPDLKEKILQALNLVGLISISLAFFNILPFPALDGGRLLFVGIEAVRGRRVAAKIESFIHSVGFFMLIILLLLITYNDILHLNFWESVKKLFP